MKRIATGATAAAALSTVLLFAWPMASTAGASPASMLQARTICDDDGRCFDAGPRFRDRDDDAPPPRRRYDPDDDDRPPPPRHRHFDPDDDDRPPPPPRRRYDPDDDR